MRNAGDIERDASSRGIEAQQLRNAVHMRVFGASADPIRIGRYTVLTRLGAGGMGVVYAAYDTELDRKVAVKLLRGGQDDAGDWRTRLRREAQALAKLSHPNVVQVYDVGEHGNQIYVPMEFVAGPNLREWVAAGPHTARQIVEVYAQGGEGLAAAHKAGIIHRDFKPENVLVGDDGRVRVLDFGLARGSGERIPTLPVDDDPALSGSHVLLTPLTREGAILGTPAYMAPEQHLGLPSDERTDQFSFCVALYEALYGKRPFAGNTIHAVRTSVLEGNVQPPTREKRVPAWIRRILLRGLAREPIDRFPSMHALLDALARDPAVLVRRILAVVAVVAVVAIAVVTVQQREEQSARERDRLSVEADRERHAKEAVQRQLEDRRDSLTLAEIDIVLERDPTRAAAMLLNLSDRAAAWSGDARIIAADATHRGIASRVGVLPPGEIPQALSADGRWLVTRAPDVGSLFVTDLSTDARTILATGTEGVPIVAIAPDSSCLVTLRGQGVSLHAPIDGSGVDLGSVPEQHHAAQWADDSTRFISYGPHPEVHVRTRSGELLVRGGHYGEVRAVAVNGSRLATVDGTGTLRVFELADERVYVGAGVGPLAFGPAGQLLAATSEAGLRLLAVAEGSNSLTVEHQWLGDGTPVRAVAFHPTRSVIAIGLGDGRVKLWSPGTDDPPRGLGQHAEEVVALRFAPDGEHVVSQGQDETLAVAAIDTDARRLLRGHDGIGPWGFDAATSEIVTVGWEGTIRHWSSEAPKDSSTKLTASSCTALASGEVTIAGTRDGAVMRWEPASNRAEVLERLGSPVSSVTIASDGAIAAAARNGNVVLLPVDGARRLIDAGDGEAVPIAFGPGGADLYVGVAGSGVRRWPTAGGPSTDIDTAGVRVGALHVSDNGSLSVVGWTPDGRTWVGRIGADSEADIRPVATDGVLAVAFDPGHGRIAWSKHTREVVLLDNGEVHVLGQHAALVDAMAFDPLGRTLVTAARDGTVKSWDPASGRHRTVTASKRALHAVAFAEGNAAILVAGDDGRIHFVADDVPHERADLLRWLRAATSLRVDTAPIATRIRPQ